jgi:hypothetical protein
MKNSTDSSLPYVALEGIQHGNRFITSNSPGEDPTKSAKGETWYRILGYAQTVEEAQNLLGSPAERHQELRDYFMMTAHLAGTDMQHAEEMFEALFPI